MLLLPPLRRPRGRPWRRQPEARLVQLAAQGLVGSQLDPPLAQLAELAAELGGLVDSQLNGRLDQLLGLKRASANLA